MKQKYQKPDIELIRFDMTETLLEGGSLGGMSAEEGEGEW